VLKKVQEILLDDVGDNVILQFVLQFGLGIVGDFDDRIDVTSDIGQKQLPYLHRGVSKIKPA
jgi:hypothetical protein